MFHDLGRAWTLHATWHEDMAMIHLSAFEGLLGFATLHPLFTLGSVLLASLVVVLAARRRHAA